MPSSVTVIEAPQPLVDLAAAKVHLRVNGVDEDVLIEAYIAAASSHIDGPGGWLRRAISPQVLELRTDSFIGNGVGAIALPFPPVIEVSSVKYVGADGVEQTVGPGDYAVSSGPVLHPAFGAAWPSPRSEPDAVRIRYRAGYEAEEAPAIPAAVTAAVLLMVGDLYQRRETTTQGGAAPVQMSTTVENLLAPYRDWRL